ncbi:MAG TPA: alanine--tRNA ligase, partial [Gammaproteobacteria bacterium]|nr:alanine--tRNA ligase [Gammaproteobacteria bacterium]
CTEIFYDHGPELAGGPPGSADEDGDRYIEIWNLVFMQFDRAADGTMNPLPKPCVDTGMGLERIAAVLQGAHSNYEIDLFQNLIGAAAKATGCKDKTNNSLKVIADHIRAVSFLIADGVLPSNEGRGYVLRRIMRRAIRHGYQLGQKKPFFHQLVSALDKEMGDAYPELHKQRDAIAKTIKTEEEKFAETLEQGMRLLEQAIAAMSGKTITGETVFKLYDTYGFPVDLTADIARERGLEVDQAGFETAMEKQRETARAASSFGADYSRDIELDDETAFTGYESLQDKGKIVALFSSKEAVKTLRAGDEGVVVLDNTPFYAESGGQIGDTGVIRTGNALFEVHDTVKRGKAFAHVGILKMGELKTNEPVTAAVNSERRAAIVLNHSATHLLHAALRKLLGTHVTQKGSLVAPDRLRFDFSHDKPVTATQLREIENCVNAEIRRNVEAGIHQMSYDDAMKFGAMALFGEKYGDTVRVLQFGDFSTELCGGTHVQRTGDIGLFRILSESGVAAGVRRIEALTGAHALAAVQQTDDELQTIAAEIRSERSHIVPRVTQLASQNRSLEKELTRLRGKLASGQGSDLASQAVTVDGVQLLAARLDGADAKALRDAVDQLKNKLKSAAVVLGATDDDKVRLVAGVTADVTDRIKAGDLVNTAAVGVGGKGGGRPDLAQAGGNAPDKLDKALADALAWMKQQL